MGTAFRFLVLASLMERAVVIYEGRVVARVHDAAGSGVCVEDLGELFRAGLRIRSRKNKNAVTTRHSGRVGAEGAEQSGVSL